jgi:hypothetical protein
MLVSGDAQSNTARGSRVTVLANATELFTNLDQSMPKFEEWVRESMGINATATLEEFEEIWLPMPSNSSTGYDASVTCVKHYGYTYYLQAQFVILCVIILFQVGGVVLWMGQSWQWISRPCIRPWLHPTHPPLPPVLRSAAHSSSSSCTTGASSPGPPLAPAPWCARASTTPSARSTVTPLASLRLQSSPAARASRPTRCEEATGCYSVGLYSQPART